MLRTPGCPIHIETLHLAAPRAGEVLVEMRASGVCHSDWHCVTGDSQVDLPVVLGHEGSGVVAALGAGVENLMVGDHVALSWIPACGQCEECRRSLPHLCSTYLEPLWAGTMLDGSIRLQDEAGTPVHHLSALSTWATHAVVPALSCVQMPDIPFELSALIGCGVTTGVGAVFNRAKVEAGSRVVVFGAGGVGLSIVLAAAAAGASTIIAVDLHPEKETLARRMGATHFIQSSAGDVADVVDAVTGGLGCDYAFDAVGHADIAAGLNQLLARRGTAVLVGLPPGGTRFSVDPIEFIREEKSLTGSIFGSADTHRDFVTYAQMYLEGALPLEELVTSRYSLDQVNEACDAMLTGHGGRGVLLF